MRFHDFINFIHYVLYLSNTVKRVFMMIFQQLASVVSEHIECKLNYNVNECTEITI